MQRIKIYPGKSKFSLTKISPDLRCLHAKHAKEKQTRVTIKWKFIRSSVFAEVQIQSAY